MKKCCIIVVLANFYFSFLILLFQRHSQKGRPEAKCEISVESKIWGQCLPESSALKSHDYLKCQIDPQSQQFAELYPAEFNELQELYTKIAQLEEENYKLRERCISLDQIQQSSDSCQFWTGFPNYGTFKALFDFLNEAAHLKTNWRGQATVESRHFSEAYKSKPGPTSKNSNEEEFLMVMIRLRAGLPLRDLAQRFALSVSSVSKICTAWINLMYFELKKLCQMPDWDQTVTAKQFSQFPHLRIVLDCTEIFCEKPSSLQANKEVYSNYKSQTTFKYLVGISPHPAVVYVSKAWGGRASDKRITQTSADLLDKLKPNDEVMADRGFEIEGTLTPLGVKLTIPDFKGQGRAQLSELEGKRSEKIAEARIHVERAIQRIKCYHILDRELRLTMASLADQIFTVCAYLVNFQTPFLR